jgi:hypothetical protein
MAEQVFTFASSPFVPVAIVGLADLSCPKSAKGKTDLPPLWISKFHRYQASLVQARHTALARFLLTELRSARS